LAKFLHMRKVYPIGLCLALCGLLHLSAVANDTTVVKHLIDGNITEWQSDKFETDKSTGISYAVDEDADNLYIAFKVSDMRTQMRLTNQGMSILFDKKGKHREGTGIEFPLKRDGGGGGFGGPGGGRRGDRGGDEQQQQQPNMDEIHEHMAARMIGLKSFGLEGLEDKAMILGQTGPINLAFNWDANNAMCIEYQVPISLIASPAELKGKTISIGWKLFGQTMPDRLPVSSSTSLVAVPSSGGGRGGGGSRAGRGQPSGGGADFPAGSDSRADDLKIWTKYLMH
jgi:hypothetical protein